MFRLALLFAISFTVSSVAYADALNPNVSTAPATNALPTVSGADQPSASPAFLLHEALELMQHKQLDAAMEKINAALQMDPANVDAYGLRGGVYAAKKDWDDAAKDYQRIIQINPDNAQAKFNLSELSFLQKKFDAARPGFVALQTDRDLKDLAIYKVFLCDLFAGHDDIASKEMAAMDQVAPGASYYFANAAWALYHKQLDDARTWLTSAARIYSQNKFKTYSASLFDFGYLPLPAKQ